MLVDVPNMLVSAFLPEDIFTGSRPRGVARRHRRKGVHVMDLKLLSRGVEANAVFHDAGGGYRAGCLGTDARATGPDPQGRSSATSASFSDPDGSGWLLQEMTERLPGRV
jgi:hypothetical protein